MSSTIDHLVLAGGDLDHLVAWFTERSGLVAIPGGAHPGWGTRNALVSLCPSDREGGDGPAPYLELIAPDPDQPRPSNMRPFGIDGLQADEIKLAAFAVAVVDLNSTVASLAASEAVPGSIAEMSRAKPDGTVLSWRYAMPTSERQQNIVPFLIQWGAGGSHPSSGLGAGGRLVGLNLQHPEPELISDALDRIDLIDADRELIEVVSGQPAVVSATLDTPNGSLML